MKSKSGEQEKIKKIITKFMNGVKGIKMYCVHTNI